MTLIAAANSSAYSAVAVMLGNASAPTDAGSSAAAASPDSSSGDVAGDPLDSLDLSDHAKATLARATFEQEAADRLAAQVDAAKGIDSSATAKPAAAKKPVTFLALAGIVAEETRAPEQTVPQVTFHSSLQALGFSVTASGDADSWSSDIQISGPGGVKAWDTIWGGGKGKGTAGGGGATLPNGEGYISRKEDGKVTFTFTSASVSASASAIASNSDRAYASTASAHVQAVDITVDFRTGGISITQADISANSTIAGVNRQA